MSRGQESEDIGQEVLGDSQWWSQRITKINRKVTPTIGLAKKDNTRHSRRWEEKEPRDPRRRPRPFASATPKPETRITENFESQRHNVRINEQAEKIFNFFGPVPPSPILLPPYDSPAPVYKNKIVGDDATTPWSNESFDAGKSSNSGEKRIRIYEITTFNSTNNEPVESKPSYDNDDDDDDSSKVLEADNEDRWVNFVRESSVNLTRTKAQEYNRTVENTELEHPRSLHIDDDPERKRFQSSKRTFDRNNYLVKNSRGNRKYQDDFESEKIFARKRTFSTSGKYDWRHQTPQRINNFNSVDGEIIETGFF